MTGWSRIDRGDLIWLDASPTVGREQNGHRPYLVLSDDRLHSRLRIVLAVPLTTTLRGWPTHVVLDPRRGRPSVAMVEQFRALSVDRVTKVEALGLDTTEVRKVLIRLTGGLPV